MKLGLIYARARNGAIGKDGHLPWHLPEDLAHFRQLTTGSPVIMGRKTWESLPPRFRPLPGRRNIVVTGQAGWTAAGAQAAPSVQAALALCSGEPTAWIIGGAALFHSALPLASVAEVTEIDVDVEGDVFMPSLPEPWVETSRVSHTSSTGIPYSFVTYSNRGD